MPGQQHQVSLKADETVKTSDRGRGLFQDLPHHLHLPPKASRRPPQLRRVRPDRRAVGACAARRTAVIPDRAPWSYVEKARGEGDMEL
jgi:hypothetical protein